MIKSQIELAVGLIKKSDWILVGSGAGMGKDSGLPDFRGNQGFWNHYPPYKGKFNFQQCANPQFLTQHPNLFWGFYGSRLQMYRKAIPHKGFNILKEFQENYGKQLFTVTSNVDGHHKKAGFKQERIYQVHGSIHHLQCQKSNCQGIIQNNFMPDIDYQKMSCKNLPFCQKCKIPMRPNILMFNDYYWDSKRTDKQQNNFHMFLQKSKKQNKSICMIQIGCGKEIPTIRYILDSVFRSNKKNRYIRINPDDQIQQKYKQKDRFVHIKSSAQKTLEQIKQLYKS